MSDEYVDPSGTTDEFRAFAQSDGAAPPARSRTPLIIGVVAAVVIAAAVVVLLVVS